VTVLCSLTSDGKQLTDFERLCLGEASFGENVATTLLTPLTEGEAEISFSPTLMVVLTALVCEYAGRVPVSPLQLLRGLSKRLISYSGPCISMVLLHAYLLLTFLQHLSRKLFF